VRALCALCRASGIWYVSDELYHGISFGAEEASAVRFAEARDTTIVVNSFSKYYAMTGKLCEWISSFSYF
jgi:aspartate/methionine/tyrosine aminotransferase